MILQGAATLW